MKNSNVLYLFLFGITVFNCSADPLDNMPAGDVELFRLVFNSAFFGTRTLSVDSGITSGLTANYCSEQIEQLYEGTFDNAELPEWVHNDETLYFAFVMAVKTLGLEHDARIVYMENNLPENSCSKWKMRLDIIKKALDRCNEILPTPLVTDPVYKGWVPFDLKNEK